MHCIVDTKAEDWAISAGHFKKMEGEAKSECGFQKRKVQKLLEHP